MSRRIEHQSKIRLGDWPRLQRERAAAHHIDLDPKPGAARMRAVTGPIDDTTRRATSTTRTNHLRGPKPGGKS
jgi:hypothetical protein